MSTYLYTGNGSTQTITNGIDLSGKGGLVWIKGRSVAYSNYLTDTVRGPNKNLFSDSTLAEQNDTNSITAFNSNGWSMDAESGINASSQTYASWTFRKQAKFFDVVTYTGNATNRTIAHDLGSTPGCIIIKRTNAGGNWFVYHRGLSNPALDFINLNTTSAASTNFSAYWNSTAPTSTVFSLGTDADINANGGTYVAYLFAHDAGGFGDSGNDSVVKCGTFSGTGFVDLGWEPQWLLIKPYSQTWNWEVYDNMRGMGQPAGSSSARSLVPNLSNAEANGSSISFEATGFTQTTFGSSYPCIYIAIRRGPMKTPTDATKVFAVDLGLDAGTSSTPSATAGFPVDMGIITSRTSADNRFITSRLTAGNVMYTEGTFAENVNSIWSFSYQNGFATFGAANPDRFAWMFRRAPGFFDVVAYTGTGAVTGFNHNLGIKPDLMIVKSRGTTNSWYVYSSDLAATKRLTMPSDAGASTSAIPWNNTEPTSTTFTLGANIQANISGDTGIAYLFATCPGVSKVGSYTGTGTTQQINCGFTAGARFVLIKRTDSTGDWYIWDSARGIISANDPYLLLNSAAAEVTNTDYIDPLSSGFQISSTAPAAINANGGSYIYLSVA